MPFQKKQTTLFSFSLVLFGLMEEFKICTTKVTFVSLFVQFFAWINVAKSICSQYALAEVLKVSEWPSSSETLESLQWSVNLRRPIFVFS